MYNRKLTHNNLYEESDNKALVREINMAKNIQTKLLNGERPKLENDEVSGISIPARLIGGDYFDFYPFPMGKFASLLVM